jgi:hypothetical protein
MKLTAILLVSILTMCGVQGMAQNTPPETSSVKLNAKSSPFVVGDSTAEYDVFVDTKDPKYAAKFTPIFKKYSLSYDANTMDELVQQILRLLDPTLAGAVLTQVDEKRLRIGTENSVMRQKFMNMMRTIFADRQKLESYLRNLEGAIIPVAKSKDTDDDDEPKATKAKDKSQDDEEEDKPKARTKKPKHVSKDGDE